jgi:hypothetical protein
MLRDPEWVTVAASSSNPLNGVFRFKDPLIGPSVFTDVSNVIVFESVYVSFTSLGPISGKLTLQTPSYELIKIATSHRLEPSLKSQILVSYGRKSVIDGLMCQMEFVNSNLLLNHFRCSCPDILLWLSLPKQL